MFPYEIEEARRQESIMRAYQGLDPASYVDPLDLAAIPSSGQISVFSGFRKTHGSKLREHFEAQEHLDTFRRIFS